jgi:hypothetical protein
LRVRSWAEVVPRSTVNVCQSRAVAQMSSKRVSAKQSKRGTKQTGSSSRMRA